VPAPQGVVIGLRRGLREADGRVTGATPNPWGEAPIRPHLPLSGPQGTDARSRNHINVLTADLVVALPGDDGTRSEVVLAVRYARPVIAFLGRGELPAGWPLVPLAATVETFVRLALPLLQPL